MAYIIRNLIFISFFIFMSACSMSDLDSLWPNGGADEEIIITEVPQESYDPEDTEDILISEAEVSDESMPIEEIIKAEGDSVENMITGDDQTYTDGAIDPSAERKIIESGAVSTYVGRRAAEMRDEFLNLSNDLNNRRIDFDQLRARGISSAETYHATVAAIGARLQVGTTPGNPILLAQYEQAQTELAEISNQGQSLVDLGNLIALLSARTSYLLEATRSAKRLRGAIDEDHRQLGRLEDDVKRSSIELTRLLEELNEAVRRRDIYLAAERRRLTQLASAISVGESFGPGLGNIPALPVGNIDKQADSNLSGNPIAILRIDGLSNEYIQGLYGAVSAALDTQPSATFTLVAVSSTAGNASEKAERAAQAREKASRVLESLISMGMPAGRLSVTEVALAEVENQEVRLYAD